MSYQERRAERFGKKVPDLRETTVLLSDEFLHGYPLGVWWVFPDFDVEWAKALVDELGELGVRLPQEAEKFLTESITDYNYRIRMRAAISLSLIGLRVPEIREEDKKRRLKFDRSGNIYLLADQLELGQLDPQNLL